MALPLNTSEKGSDMGSAWHYDFFDCKRQDTPFLYKIKCSGNERYSFWIQSYFTSEELEYVLKYIFSCYDKRYERFDVIYRKNIYLNEENAIYFFLMGVISEGRFSRLRNILCSSYNCGGYARLADTRKRYIDSFPLWKDYKENGFAPDSKFPKEYTEVDFREYFELDDDRTWTFNFPC